MQHPFATHLVATGYDIRTVQHVLGHRDLRTTMIYTQVLNRGGLAAESPPDTLSARALRVQADDPGVLPMAHKRRSPSTLALVVSTKTAGRHILAALVLISL